MFDPALFEELVRRAALRCGAVATRHTSGRLHILFESTVCLAAELNRTGMGGTEYCINVHVNEHYSRRRQLKNKPECLRHPDRGDIEARLSGALNKVHELSLTGSSGDDDPRSDVLSVLRAVQRTQPDRLTFTPDGDGGLDAQIGPLVRVAFKRCGATGLPVLSSGPENRRIGHLIRRVTSHTS